MSRLLRTLAPAALLAALPGCWVPLERGDIMDSRLDKLEASSDTQAKRLDDQQRRIDEQERVIKDRVAAVDKKIAEAQQKIDELNQAARRSGADLGVAVTRIQDDLAKAKGDLEVEEHKLDELSQRLNDLQQTTDTRFAALRGRGALDEAEAKQLIEALPRKDDKAAFLALAQQQEQKGNVGVARALYDEYVRRFPAEPSAVDATIHSGDLAMGQGRFKEAFVAYGWVTKNAPRSERMPDALLGMATSMLELDELKADAPAVLKQIVQQYPKSAAAAKAKAKLAELAPPPPAKKPKRAASPAPGGAAPAAPRPK
ncbi:MAG TPA: tetratricopeptide repeat protein [Anaeromyxobacter sp.]|nr:tetratricopeptide repeat protein [Anaeromyxobacter sp.]